MIDLVMGVGLEIWRLFLIVSPWLLLGLLIAGLIHAFIGEEFVRYHLGGSGLIPVLKATLFGIPLPVCSCGVIPIAAGIRKDGASKAATMAFMTSTPTTGVDSIFVTYAFLGMAFTIARPLAALFAGILIGLLIHFTLREEFRPAVTHGAHAELPVLQKLREGLSYGFRVLPQDIGKTLLVGILVGGVIAALIPKDIAQGYLSIPYIAYPLMLAISVPLYVCAIGSVPIVAALLMKGLVPGAALAFLIAGPATNTITLAFVGKKMGRKVLILYLSAIILIAIGFGLGLDLLTRGISFEWSGPAGSRPPYLLQLIATFLLLFLIIFNLRSGQAGEEMRYSFYVPDMTCKHCKMTIEQALRGLPGVEKVEIILDKKIVGISGEVDPKTIRREIEAVGYSVRNETEQ